MPRQGVPYPSREICSLKCQIDALNAKINELMKSINGVQGDGQGNVSLISGDPAVVINNDASQNQIEIALDSSQLPAAAVSSVNSQTGAVVLEADDIPSDGNSDVQADIDALKALGVNLQGAIGNEVTARGNADAALQGNINTVQASIPGEAANAVANDPTVIQLATDVPNKLDKITSGNSLKAYTHTGATQGEKSVVDGVDADSIAIRDANGRLQAADPASGATDKTLVTSNWISQTGNNAPNNLLHRSGNEAFTGNKAVDGMLQHAVEYHTYYCSGNYCHMFDVSFTTRVQVYFEIFTYKGTGLCAVDTVPKTSSEKRGGFTLFDPSGWWAQSNNKEIFILYNETTSKIEVWAHFSTAVSFLIKSIRTYGTAREFTYITNINTTQSTDPRDDTTTYPAGDYQLTRQVI